MVWRYKIKFKNLLESAPSYSGTSRLISRIKVQLEKINSNISGVVMNHGRLKEDEIDDLQDKLEKLIDDFNFVHELMDGTIPKDTWHEYDYNGDYVSLFNDYLDELYDLGDIIVFNTKNKGQKFIWVE